MDERLRESERAFNANPCKETFDPFLSALYHAQDYTGIKQLLLGSSVVNILQRRITQRLLALPSSFSRQDPPSLTIEAGGILDSANPVFQMEAGYEVYNHTLWNLQCGKFETKQPYVRLTFRPVGNNANSIAECVNTYLMMRDFSNAILEHPGTDQTERTWLIHHWQLPPNPTIDDVSDIYTRCINLSTHFNKLPWTFYESSLDHHLDD